MEWFYRAEEQQQGPIDESQLAELIQSGTVLSETFVWSVGMENWTQAGSTKLVGLFGVQPPPFVQPTSQPPPIPLELKHEDILQEAPKPTSPAKQALKIFLKIVVGIWILFLAAIFIRLIFIGIYFWNQWHNN